MQFQFAHYNYNVKDLDKAIRFYQEALGLREIRRKEAAHQKYQQMGCICYENPDMGIYFISDPDGYWQEIVPAK